MSIKRQIQWLTNNYFERKDTGHISGSAVPSKISLMKGLRAKQILNLETSVTNYLNKHYKIGNFSIESSYSRQIFITHNSRLNEFYPLLKTKTYPAQGHFLSSGQSAIYILLKTLQQVYGQVSLSSPTNIYFESSIILKELTLNSKASKIKVLFLDSTYLSPTDITEGSIKKNKIIIFDTTCLVWNDPIINKVVRLCYKSKRDLYLVRSHLKLDCLGGEYTLLGSIVVLSKTKALNDTLVKTISYHGAYPSLDQIYPFYHDKKFHQFTEERVKRIKKNTYFLIRKLRPLIDKMGYEITEHYHGLYFFIRTPLRDDNHAVSFSRFFYLNNSNAYYCDSFGFDFGSVCHYPETWKEDKKSCFRICGSDLNKKELLGFYDSIEQYFSYIHRSSLAIKSKDHNLS